MILSEAAEVDSQHVLTTAEELKRTKTLYWKRWSVLWAGLLKAFLNSHSRWLYTPVWVFVHFPEINHHQTDVVVSAVRKVQM